VSVDGISGLYKGYPVALFGIVMFRALSMGGYDFVKGEVRLDEERRMDGRAKNGRSKQSNTT